MEGTNTGKGARNPTEESASQQIRLKVGTHKRTPIKFKLLLLFLISYIYFFSSNHVLTSLNVLFIGSPYYRSNLFKRNSFGVSSNTPCYIFIHLGFKTFIAFAMKHSRMSAFPVKRGLLRAFILVLIRIISG